jgi:hypothetical protein
MKELFLEREKSTDTETMGRLNVGEVTLHTVEQEWRSTHPGGQPNNSCVPAGRYKLIKHTRPNGDNVLALVNPGHAVYHYDHQRPNDVGRFLILLHSGNTSKDVVGCIAPGLSRSNAFVGSSRPAMGYIMDYVGDDDAVLHISWSNGEPE